MRLALLEGMHTDLPAAQIGVKFAERCRNLWWTIYILDRTLSSAVGAPVSVQDAHIRQPLGSPTDLSPRDAILVLHVKLCRVVSSVLNGKNKTGGKTPLLIMYQSSTLLMAALNSHI